MTGDSLPRLRIGLGIFTGQTPPGSSISVADEYGGIVDMAVCSEEVGFDSFWLSEHHGAEDNYLPSMLPVAAGIACRTSRIAIGTAILIPSLWHPLRLAEDVAVVDQLARGRMRLGLGLGWRRKEFESFGVELKERAERTTEMIHLLRRLWTGQTVDHDGRFYTLKNATVRPRPFAGQVPILLAGSQERPIRRAAAISDGLIYSATGPTAASVQPNLDHLHTALGAADDERGDREALPVTLLLNVALPDGEPWSLIGTGVDHQYTMYGRWKAEDAGTPFGSSEAKAVAEAGRKLIIHGAPDKVVERLDAWIRAVLPRRSLHLVVKLHYPGVAHRDTVRMMEKFAARILPELRARWTQPEVHIQGHA